MISFKADSPHDVVLLSFSPDAGILAVGLEYQRTEFRDPTTGELLFAVDNGSGRHSHFWGGPNRRTLFVNRHGHGVIPIDPDAGRVLPRLTGWVGSGPACFTSDGQYSINTRDTYHNGDFTCWKLSDDGCKAVWSRPMA